MKPSPTLPFVVPFRAQILTTLVAAFLGLEAVRAPAQEGPDRVRVIVDRTGHPDLEKLARSIPGVEGAGAKMLARTFRKLQDSALASLAKGDQAKGVDRRALEALLREHPCGDLGLEGVPISAEFQVLAGGKPGSASGGKAAPRRPGRSLDQLKAALAARPSSKPGPRSGTATLEAHGATGSKNNYAQATFNFWFGTRDDAKLTLNRWDVKFVESRGTPMLEVARHSKTPSAMADLGEIPLKEITNLWAIEGLFTETTTGRLEAQVGHAYVLHVDDREHDYWAALQVTGIDPKAHTVTFDWRRL